MEPKYYFISYWYGTWNNAAGTWEFKPANAAIDKHPGRWQAKSNAYAKETGRRSCVVVFGWQEITLEEYVALTEDLQH